MPSTTRSVLDAENENPRERKQVKEYVMEEFKNRDSILDRMLFQTSEDQD
jgi:hypothetical protein